MGVALEGERPREWRPGSSISLRQRRYGAGRRPFLFMRAIVGILCLLLGVGMLSCRYEGLSAKPQAAGRTQVRGWVRTVDGWERAGSWQVDEVGPPGLHPLVVAAGQGLVSLLGLAACGRERQAVGGRSR
jgi:hypothetical protein